MSRRRAALSLVFGLLAAVRAHAEVVTPKRLCDGFEAALPTLPKSCVGAVQDKATRARQQCLELLELSNHDKHARIDQSAARACLAARAAFVTAHPRTAALADAMRTACATAVVGLRTVSRGCDSAFDCASGLSCRGPTGAPPGKCQKPLPSGSFCNDDALNASAFHALLASQRGPCQPNERCVSSPSGATCRPTLAAGAACKPSEDACAPGLHCAEGATCTPDLRSLGDDCASP